ncbi:MAG: branched-chain amino acid ABC transporter substrate-binding protein [Hyphomicrobiaceae bacterium]
MPRLAATAIAVLFASLAALSPANAQTEAGIRLVVVATDASAHQPNGRDVATAAETAVAAINRKGGLLGRRVTLSIKQDDCSPASADAIAREIAAIAGPERPDAVIGHVCSGAAIVASRAYAEAGLLVISPGARHPRLTDQRPSPLVLRLAPRDDRLAGDLATLIGARFSGQRVAIVHDKSVQARGLADGIEAALRQSGIKLVLREPYTHGEKSYAPTIERLRKAEAQVVVFPAQLIELGVMLPELAAALPAAHFIAGEAVASPDIARTARPVGQRLLVMLPWLERPPHALADGAETPPRATSRARERPRSNVWLATHAAIEAWANAITKANSTDALAIVRALETEVATTVAGPIRFDTRGDVAITSYVPWAWHEDDWQQLKD